MGTRTGNPAWQAWPSTATPVTAGALQAIENALDGTVASAGLDAATAALVADTLRELGGFSVQTGVGKTGVVGELGSGDLLAAEERYVDLFDRGRALSLNLFEHLHGESRDRR